jgi:hypothetical protein
MVDKSSAFVRSLGTCVKILYCTLIAVRTSNSGSTLNFVITLDIMIHSKWFPFRRSAGLTMGCVQWGVLGPGLGLSISPKPYIVVFTKG